MRRDAWRRRYAIVLAAGEGKRLQGFVQRLRGDTLPKQFVAFGGERSMLEETLVRVQWGVAPDNIVTIVGQHHTAYPEVRRQLDGCPGTVVLQPRNRETGPGVLLPLLHVVKRDPDATVAIFPSDHFVGDDPRFMAHVDRAFAAVSAAPERVAILGVRPDAAESDYGWIQPGGPLDYPARGLCGVERFVEKPDRRVARRLFEAGGLWNTMVLVARAGTLLGMASRLLPELWRQLRTIHGAIGRLDEAQVTRAVYEKLQPVTFSHGLLERAPDRLQLVTVEDVLWSDWGSEARILATLERVGRRHLLADTAIEARELATQGA